jgi:uncharacterized protein YidB (DUF937 family)
MGLLDGLLGNVINSVLGGAQGSEAQNPLGAILSGLTGGNSTQGNSLLGAVLAMVQQQGGIGAITEKFRQSGLAQQADSWVSTGPNLGISADQLQQVVSPSALGGLASLLGPSGTRASSALAQILPELINQLTPQGQVPDNDNDIVSQALAMLQGRAS